PQNPQRDQIHGALNSDGIPAAVLVNHDHSASPVIFLAVTRPRLPLLLLLLSTVVKIKAMTISIQPRVIPTYELPIKRLHLLPCRSTTWPNKHQYHRRNNNKNRALPQLRHYQTMWQLINPTYD
ncbi:unnamed protein product, partial [Linum tenue]